MPCRATCGRLSHGEVALQYMLDRCARQEQSRHCLEVIHHRGELILIRGCATALGVSTHFVRIWPLTLCGTSPCPRNWDTALVVHAAACVLIPC
jgi:hypothetical protein